MSFYKVTPSEADFEATLRFVFEAWFALPPPPDATYSDEATVALHQAFLVWCDAKQPTR